MWARQRSQSKVLCFVCILVLEHVVKMATSHLSDHMCRPIPHRSATFRRLTTTKTTIFFLSPPKCSKSGSFLFKTDQKSKWVVRLSLVEQNPPKPPVDMKQLVDFLYDDFPHLFDDQGTDRTAYDERVKFRDPITKFDSISGYLFNIAMLKKLFSPDLQLHWVKQVCFSTVIYTCMCVLVCVF